ncbi:MAG: peroxiredoxin [Myxococcales bacterium]|nr:peroxiredoxin [Myxococcales bacterium]
MAVLVNKPAPAFTAEAVLPDGSFAKLSLEQYLGKYVVLFFYPLDFTFVCPTEIIAFDHRIAEFEQRNTVVLGCSVDSKFSHWAWREMKVRDGGIGAVRYPLLADITKSIAKDYDVMADDAKTLRASFLIDKNGKVQHQVVNNLDLGRNVDEMLRMVDALQHTETNGEVCPAGWTHGKAAMKANRTGVAEFLGKNARKL